MKPFAAALYCGALAALIVHMITGSAGLLALRKLKERSHELNANISALKEVESALNSRKSELEDNEEALILAARKVGLYREGEKLIILEEPDPYTETGIGHILRAEKQPPMPDWPPKLAFIFVFALTYIGKIFFAPYSKIIN